MAFTQKLKKVINDIRESTGKTPEEELPPSQFVSSPAVSKFKERALLMQALEHMSEYTNDPQVDREIIESIGPEYFSEDNFDASERELKNLPEVLELRKIDEDRLQLKKQLTSVSRKVSELVLENHPAYATELTRVMELQQSLQQATVICSSGRRSLANAKDGFTTASLGLLANYRKRQQLIALLTSLRTIKTLQRTDIRLREMLEEEDYPGAIQLCLECQKAASTFRHYKCISELSSKLQDTLEMIEESLDVALSKTCNGFDEKHYEKVQIAYKLLGKTQTAMDQLHMHFASAIHNTAFTIVLGYVELCSGTGDASFQKRQYSDLCKNVTPEVFTPCLVDLCKALWEVMKSYHQTIKWHEQNGLENANGEAAEGTNEASLSRRYIQQKLEHGLERIWGDVQQKVKIYLLSKDLSFFKYDEFIQVLDIVNRLILIGEEFCGSKSEGLQDSIRKQSLSYFHNYHRLRMDELRMFLENEGWQLCPVKASFSITMLLEFRFMRKKLETQNMENVSINSENSEDGKKGKGYFTSSKSPFDIQAEEEESEDVLETNGFTEDTGMQGTFSNDSDSDDDVPAELKGDFIDEQTGEVKIQKSRLRSRRRSDKSGKQAPIVTNTTLNVCRLFGKYIQMMTVLKPIAFDVIICMSKLFDYYLYSVYSFFATDVQMNELNQSILSSRLRTTLKRIKDNLIIDDDQYQQQTGAPVAVSEDRVPHPHLSTIVNLIGQESLFGLAERIVATESLVFLAEQIEFLKPQLEATIPPAKKAFLQQFYSQTVSVAAELRKPVYRTVAAKTIDYENLLQLMAAVKWDIKELMSQHSPYVDVLLKDLEKFSIQLDHVTKRVPIPKVVSDVLWEHAIKLANRTVVEGYASAKKCSNEGRALMQLDFQQFLMKLEKLSDLRPIPDREFVEAYVKAYYLPEAQLELWIRDHKEYTSKQMITLVNCVGHINKKSRQRLTNMIEDMDKYRR